MAGPGSSRTSSMRSLLRPSTGAESRRVTFAELFFDLVFVFAVTQVSHVLISHQSAYSLASLVILTAAVWWVWVFTTWAVNWLDPERALVRLLLIVLMLLGLLMAAAIPESFGPRALLFAVALVLTGVVRSFFTAAAFGRDRPANAANFRRIGVWVCVGGVLWVAGALLPDSWRIWVWLAAIVFDYLGPRAQFWVPVAGASDMRTWDVTGEHMSERVSLFIIIVLGESIIVTGETFSDGDFSAPRVLAFGAAFVGTVLLWMLFFNHGERGGSEYISHAADRGVVARAAYSYIPVLLVLGVVLSAVGDGLLLEHPDGAGEAWSSWLICGSSALYILGNVVFRLAVGGPLLVGALIGAGLLVVLAIVGPALPTLAMAWIADLLLVGVVVADEALWRRVGRGGAAMSPVGATRGGADDDAEID